MFRAYSFDNELFAESIVQLGYAEEPSVLVVPVFAKICQEG
jgi:hypothetical protein